MPLTPASSSDVLPTCEAAQQIEITVLVTTYLGADRIARCLESLATQTLDRARYEVVVVQNGPVCDTPAVVDAVRAGHPDLHLRLVELTRPGLGHARNVGLRSAVGTYVTFVDDDDWVTPGYLEGLLRLASADVVPVALVSSVHEHRVADGDDVDLDNYASANLLPRAGQLVERHLVPAALSFNAAKLLRRDVAMSVRYDETLRSGEDFVYWLEVSARHAFRVHVVGADDDVVYCRTQRDGSLGRQARDYDFLVTQRLDCLQAIEERVLPVAAGEPHGDRADLADLIAYMRAGQARLLRSHLEQHPEDQQRVAREVVHRGLRAFPWRDVNVGRARDLAISYCFPPDLDTSGLVAARRLREWGVLCDVVSDDMSRIRDHDPGSRMVADPVVARHEALRTPPTFEGWPAITEFADQAVRRVLEWERANGSAYRTVYSRSMAIGSHLAAGLLSVRRPDLTWTAEFSDPLSLNSQGGVRQNPMTPNWLSDELVAAAGAAGFDLPTDRVFQFAELATYALADRLLFTNPRQLEVMLGHCPIPALAARVESIAEVSAHPTLPPEYYRLEDPAYELDPLRVHVAYFGVFYPTRGLGDVLRAVDRLPWETRAQVRLHVFTSDPDALRLEVSRMGVGDVVQCRPFVPYLEFLALTTRFDALLVNDTATAGRFPVNPYLPSKLADYLGSGRPIWAQFEPGSMLSALPVEHRCEIGDVAGAARVIDDLVRSHAAAWASAATG